ncbi:hypothetical protein ACQKFM_22485 [Paenibacillus xylanexedens]|uniref:hypothetical protein n=1 Tax=Paenibacillus xylanexedens TaxID=528191 RepID=UPI003D0033C1
MKRVLLGAFLALVLMTLLTSCSYQDSTERSNEILTVESPIEHAYVEVPNVRVIESPIHMSSSNILDQTIVFTGQGSIFFEEKGIEGKVLVYVKNIGKRALSYTLKSPTKTVWYSTTLAPGEEVTTENIFKLKQAGEWYMYFSTSDGSAGSVTVSAIDAETNF